jgi:hypothetical protein
MVVDDSSKVNKTSMPSQNNTAAQNTGAPNYTSAETSATSKDNNNAISTDSKPKDPKKSSSKPPTDSKTNVTKSNSATETPTQAQAPPDLTTDVKIQIDAPGGAAPTKSEGGSQSPTNKTGSIPESGISLEDRTARIKQRILEEKEAEKKKNRSWRAKEKQCVKATKSACKSCFQCLKYVFRPTKTKIHVLTTIGLLATFACFL